MTFLALIAIIFFGFAVYNLTCAFVDIPTKKTSQMMMLSRKQQGTKNEKLLDVYVTKIAGWIAPYLRLDRLKRNKVQRALDIAGLQLTPEVYTARAWVTAGAVGLCAIPMAFLIPLLVPILIGLAVALWFSTYYAAFDFVKKRRKLIEGEIPRFALTVGQSLENDRDVASSIADINCEHNTPRAIPRAIDIAPIKKVSAKKSQPIVFCSIPIIDCTANSFCLRRSI